MTMIIDDVSLVAENDCDCVYLKLILLNKNIMSFGGIDLFVQL